MKPRPYCLDGNGFLITGFPNAGKSLLWEMLKHTLYRHAFDTGACAGIRNGVVSKFGSAVFSWPKFQPTHNCVIMIRDPHELLNQKANSGEYVLSAHSSNVKCAKHLGLVEWWRAIQSLKGAFILRFEKLVSSPDEVQAKLGEWLNIDYQDNRWFSQIKPRDHCGSLSDEQKERIKSQVSSNPELEGVFYEMGYPYQPKSMRNAA
jgi:hypothetical protein